MKMKRVSAAIAVFLGTLTAFGQVNGNFNNLNANGNITNSHGTVIPSTITGDHGTGPRIQLSDGTGTAGNFASFDSAGNITNGGGFTAISWANVTGSRSFGVQYQNTSGSAMYISGWGFTSGSSVGGIDCLIGPSSANSAVDSTTFTATINSGHAVFHCLVPAGYYYQLNASNAVNGGVGGWNEFVGFGGGTSGGGGSGPVTMSGDVTGLSSGSVLSQLQGTSLICNSPVTNAVPVLVGGSFRCSPLTLDQILPAFAITSFTCSACGTLQELGQTISGPVTGVASYTSLPASATVLDSNTNSTTLTTPFTSWGLAGPYTRTSAGSITFTLTAIAATTKTSVQSLTWAPRTFGGVGTAGATGASGSGTNAILSGATGTLASGGLNNAATYGSYSPSGQKIYILMIGGSHTFKDQNGFTFAMNSPTSITFVNQFGTSVTMFLYESTSLLSANYTITVAS